MFDTSADSSFQYLLVVLVACLGGLGSLALFFVGFVLSGLRSSISKLFGKVDKNCEDISALKERTGLAHRYDDEYP